MFVLDLTTFKKLSNLILREGLQWKSFFVYERPFDCAQGDKQKRLQRKARPGVFHEGSRPKINGHLTANLVLANLSN